MKIFYITLLYLLHISCSLYGSINFPFVEITNDPTPLEKAKFYDLQEITVRGFLYQTSEGQWILSTEPNLKTCCVGSKQKAHKQIALEKSFEGIKADHVIALKGKFNIQDEAHPFLLTNVLIEKIPEYNPPWFWLTAGVLLLFIIILFVLKKFK